MEKFFNHIYYSFYLFECYTALLFKKILSFIFYPITRIKFLREYYEKRGSSFQEMGNLSTQTVDNPKYGQSITIAGIYIGGLLVIIEWSLFNFMQAILGKSLIQYIMQDRIIFWASMLGLIVIPWVITHFLIWKDDKYLAYFKRFKKESNGTKIKWALISFGVVVGVILFLIFSFWVWSETAF